jgi:hypothetical protein
VATSASCALVKRERGLVCNCQSKHLVCPRIEGEALVWHHRWQADLAWLCGRKLEDGGEIGCC